MQYDNTPLLILKEYNNHYLIFNGDMSMLSTTHLFSGLVAADGNLYFVPCYDHLSWTFQLSINLRSRAIKANTND